MADVLRASVELPHHHLHRPAGDRRLSLAAVARRRPRIEADSADGLLDDALEPLNLSEVPATILLTVIGLAGWFVSVLASVFLLDSRTGMALAILSIIVGVGAAVFALGFTMWIAPKLGQMALSDEVAGDGAAVAMPQAVQDQHSRAKRIRAQPEDSQRPTKSATAPAIFPTESGTL